MILSFLPGDRHIVSSKSLKTPCIMNWSYSIQNIVPFVLVYLFQFCTYCAPLTL